MLSHAQKSQVFAWIALAFSSIAFIPLAIIFDGCSSTSSPPSFYFMKINLTDFPQLKALHIRQPVGIGEIDTPNFVGGPANIAETATKIAASSISEASSTADNGVNQAREHIQSLTEDLKSHLPAYYTVGLRSYCQQNRGSVSYSNCSMVSDSFSFDLLSLFGSFAGTINSVLSSRDKKLPETYHRASQFAILAYIIGTAATALAILSGAIWLILNWRNIHLPRISSTWPKVLTRVFSLFASVFLLCASITATAIYVPVKIAIQDTLQALGIYASLGGLLIAAWFAVVFSLVATCLFYLSNFAGSDALYTT